MLAFPCTIADTPATTLPTDTLTVKLYTKSDEGVFGVAIDGVESVRPPPEAVEGVWEFEAADPEAQYFISHTVGLDEFYVQKSDLDLSKWGRDACFWGDASK